MSALVVPRSDLVPYPFKILQMQGLVVSLYEAVPSYRQIFTDGRAFQEKYFGIIPK